MKALLALGFALFAGVAPAAEAPQLGDLGQVGTVYLQTSCTPAAQKEIERATALLHSFFYEEARRVFTSAAERDPRCALAHWGVAMTWWHPIWTPPSEPEQEAGRQAIARAREIGGRTDRERGYIAALEAFYATPPGAPGEPVQTCHGVGGGDHASRAQAYEKAMEKLSRAPNTRRPSPSTRGA